MTSSCIDLLSATTADLDSQFDNLALDDLDDEVATQKRGVVQFVLDDDQSYKAVDPRVAKARENKDKGHSRSILLSALYAIVLIMVGLVFPVTEALKDEWITHNVVGVFLVYLYGFSIIFLIYVQVYHVRKQKRRDRKDKREKRNKARKAILDSQSVVPNDGDVVLTKRKMSHESLPREAGGVTSVSFSNAGSSLVSTNGMTSPPPAYHRSKSNSESAYDTASMFTEEGEDIQEYITLKSGTATLSHEGTSFYLRLGCLLFAIGNLIFVALNIEYEFGGYMSPECSGKKVRYPPFFHLTFIGVQTFFLFKNCSLVIKKHKNLVRFGLMHVLATNMCTWLRVLVEEIMHGIHESGHGVHMEDMDQLAGGEEDSNNSCIDTESLMAQASPYLFPFILEYSLIAVAAMASMYSAMDIHVTRDIIDAVKKALRRARKKGEDLFELHHERADGGFDKAHIGMFLGMVVLAGVVISVVLFYYWGASEETELRADLTFHVSDIALNAILLFATIVGMIQLYPLGFDLNRENSIDHNLLIVSMMGLIILEMFSMLASFIALTWSSTDDDVINILNATSGIVAVIQALLQTIFIIDGMQRFCVTEKQLEKKPGRGTITFMIVANVAVWVFKTFQEKKLSVQDERIFFGDIAWPLILNISLPLLLFFRFHSSICLADMWHSAYQEEEQVVDSEIL